MNVDQPCKTYHSTASLTNNCQYHVVFCPKYRRQVLVDGIDMRLKELILEKQDEYGYKVIEMKVMPDHVHLLLDVNPQVGMMKVVGQIKGYTAHVIRKAFPGTKSRLPSLWARSKFISTCGAVWLEVVKQYLQDQKGK
jgi:putative transposase